MSEDCITGVLTLYEDNETLVEMNLVTGEIWETVKGGSDGTRETGR